MFGSPHFDRVRQVFADQFEQDQSAVLYRKSMKGPPVRVSEAERDAYVFAFNHRLRLMGWSIVPATILLIAGLALLVPDADSLSGQAALYGGLVFVLGMFLVGFYWAWYAPARDLGGRQVEGSARSREEMRHLGFARMTYGQLGFAVLAAIGMVWKVSLRQNVMHGWGIVWLIVGGAMILAAVIGPHRVVQFDC